MRVWPPPSATLLAADALGLALFALVFWAGMIVVVALRLLAIRWGLHLPVFRKS